MKNKAFTKFSMSSHPQDISSINATLIGVIYALYNNKNINTTDHIYMNTLSGYIIYFLEFINFLQSSIPISSSFNDIYNLSKSLTSIFNKFNDVPNVFISLPNLFILDITRKLPLALFHLENLSLLLPFSYYLF